MGILLLMLLGQSGSKDLYSQTSPGIPRVSHVLSHPIRTPLNCLLPMLGMYLLTGVMERSAG